MSHFYRALLPVIAGSILLAGSVPATDADDYLSRAVAQYRDKDFMAAYTSAGKSSDQTYRAFVRGMAAFRQEKFDEALPLLAEAEQKVPLLADYALFFQAESLLKLKKYPAATAKVTQLFSAFPGSRLGRRTEKLAADILREASDFKGALKLYQAYVEKYPSGSDSVDAAFQAARCREELADYSGALLGYRSVWLNNPVSAQAAKAQERLKVVERGGAKSMPYSADELLKRAAAQYNQSEYSACLKTLEMITATPPQGIADRIDLRSGMAQYRLRQYKQAEKHFVRAAASTISGVRSEGRFWLAKSLERQDLKERALSLYLELAEEGKKQEFADDALVEAAGLKRGLGQYGEAARLFDRAAKLSGDSKAVVKATWDGGWCRYLAGESVAAAEIFKGLLGDDVQREKALYWLARTLEKSGDTAGGAAYFKTLLNEYPAGFYATWHREQRGIKDSRETLGSRDPLTELPVASGYEKPRLLALLGLQEEARIEIAALRKKSGEKKSLFPALARVYLEIRDYSSAIALFMQNRPVAWEKNTLPLWTAGYPRAYTELVTQNAALNGLSEGLVYALIRAESGFSPAIKSSAGAVGLMQMMPATAKLTAREKGEFNAQKLTVPEYNVRLGTRHLHDLMKEYNGDVVYMAAAYNAGANALERWKKNGKTLAKDEFIESIPYQETRDYVKKVYASAATYRQLYGVK